MNDQYISERQKLILKSIVEAHISQGDPVGSKYLCDNDLLKCSSATIRNEMANLKALGFIEQPHTSAGSVPTELGYRYYVNSLVDRYNMTQNEIYEMQSNLNRKISELDQILAEASKLASAFTKYPSLAAKPKNTHVKINRFDAVYLDVQSFVLIMVLQGANNVRSKVINTSYPLTKEELAQLIDLLNTYLVNIDSSQMNLEKVIKIEDEMGNCASVVNPLVKIIFEELKELDDGDLKVEGANKLLDIPDYENVSEVKNLLNLFESKEDLLKIMSDVPEDNDVHVIIGHENTVDSLGNSTIVYRTIRSGNKVLGAIGIIGPRRMDYSKVISVINNLAMGVDHLLNSSNKNDEI